MTIAQGDLRLATIADPVTFYRLEKMKFGGKRPTQDRSTVIYNANITITGIPLEAYDYVVNGKPALEWVMERQGVKVDKASGITWDANSYANETMGDPAYPLKLFQRVVTVSLETIKIVRALPRLDLWDGAIGEAGNVSADDFNQHLGDTIAASIAFRIRTAVNEITDVAGQEFTFRQILSLINESDASDDFIASLVVLTQSENAIFEVVADYIDDEGVKIRLSSTEFNDVLTSDALKHPLHGFEVFDASSHVFPILKALPTKAES